MLAVGIDWAEEFHRAALGRPGEGVCAELGVRHEPRAVHRLLARIAAREPDPAAGRVVIETRHGALVGALLDAGCTVAPLNPDVVARRRGPARKKDDREDARIACQLGLDRFAALRPLIPHREAARELRAIARDDGRAAQAQRRRLSRMRMDLLPTVPAARTLAGDDLGAPVLLACLEPWPTHAALAAAARADVAALARTAHHGWPERFADQVAQALATDHFVARPGLVAAEVDSIRLAVQQLRLLGQQPERWARRMGARLLGPWAIHRAAAAESAAGARVPGGEIYLSFPGLGVRLAARVGAEIGDQLEPFATPNNRPADAGHAPVTRRFGTSEFVVARRLACNHHLSNAVRPWAFCSLRQSAWAHDFSDAYVARGHRHPAAARALGNRWLELLWHGLTRGVPYDEATHVANRQHPPSPAA